MKMFWVLAAFALVLLSLTAAAGQLSGLAAVERYRGVYAPVWNSDGETIYYAERSTSGVVLGLGWEFFTPPAHSYILSDTLALKQLHPQTGTQDTLLHWASTPLVGRWSARYRGRIFGTLQARIETSPDALEYSFRLSIPRQPSSETYGLRGHWPANNESADWQRPAPAQMFGYSENSLLGGTELITVPGPESFPSAILAIQDGGSVRTVLAMGDFRTRYPESVPERVLKAQSHRERIERRRDFRRTYAARVAHHKAKGMADGTARLKAYDDLKEMGYLPKDPTLTAVRLPSAPTDSPVFSITGREFQVGLFRDIEQAIEQPGKPVDKAPYRYLRHEAFDTSARLNAWLEDHDRFAVKHDGHYYRLEIRRPDGSQGPTTPSGTSE